MDRRKALKSLGAVALYQLSSKELFAMARGMHARLQDFGEGERYIFKSLDPEHNELVAVVSELIVPETDTQGAKAARVNEFIDLMLTEWFNDEERARFLKGLAELDRDASSAHGLRFVACNEAQQVALLREREEEALGSSKELETLRSPVAPSTSPAERPFFAVMKWLTLYGYFTSEVAMEQELEHVIFPGTYEGCAPLRRA